MIFLLTVYAAPSKPYLCLFLSSEKLIMAADSASPINSACLKYCWTQIRVWAMSHIFLTQKTKNQKDYNTVRYF